MSGRHEFTVSTKVTDEQKTHIVHRLGRLVLNAAPRDIFWYEDTQLYQLGIGNNYWLRIHELPEKDGYWMLLTSRYSGQAALEKAANTLCEELRQA